MYMRLCPLVGICFHSNIEKKLSVNWLSFAYRTKYLLITFQNLDKDIVDCIGKFRSLLWHSWFDHALHFSLNHV